MLAPVWIDAETNGAGCRFWRILQSVWQTSDRLSQLPNWAVYDGPETSRSAQASPLDSTSPFCLFLTCPRVLKARTAVATALTYETPLERDPQIRGVNERSRGDRVTPSRFTGRPHPRKCTPTPGSALDWGQVAGKRLYHTFNRVTQLQIASKIKHNRTFPFMDPSSFTALLHQHLGLAASESVAIGSGTQTPHFPAPAIPHVWTNGNEARTAFFCDTMTASPVGLVMQHCITDFLGHCWISRAHQCVAAVRLDPPTARRRCGGAAKTHWLQRSRHYERCLYGSLRVWAGTSVGGVKQNKLCQLNQQKKLQLGRPKSGDEAGDTCCGL